MSIMTGFHVFLAEAKQQLIYIILEQAKLDKIKSYRERARFASFFNRLLCHFRTPSNSAKPFMNIRKIDFELLMEDQVEERFSQLVRNLSSCGKKA